MNAPTPKFDSFREQLWKLYNNPLHLVGGLLDTFRGWWSTRQWIAIALTLPIVLFFVGVMVTAGLVRFQRGVVLKERYLSLAKMEISESDLIKGAFGKLLKTEPEQRREEPESILTDDEENGSDGSSSDGALEEDEETPLNRIKSAELIDEVLELDEDGLRSVRVMLNRVTQLDPKDAEAKFRLVLTDYLLRQPAESEEFLEEIAPTDQNRYGPAHAWRAMSLLINARNGDAISSKEVIHHFESAREWEEINPLYLIDYAWLLLKLNKPDRALEVAQEAALKSSRLHIIVADIARVIGRNQESRQAAEIAFNYFSPILGTEDETESDRLSASAAQFFMGSESNGKQLLREALEQSAKPQPKVRRRLSSLIISDFGRSFKVGEDDKPEVEMDLLVEAAEIDPNNPAIGEAVARLALLKLRPPKKVIDLMREQVSNGAATVDTYMILASTFVQRGQLEPAIKQWESALEQDPSNVNALNNLGVALCRVRKDAADYPARVQRAEQMLLKAMRIVGAKAELLDSYGEILLYAGNFPKAITHLELAISQAPGRNNTRERLVNAYEELGMTEMVTKHREVLKMMREKEKSKQAKAEKADDNSDQNSDIESESAPK